MKSIVILIIILLLVTILMGANHSKEHREKYLSLTMRSNDMIQEKSQDFEIRKLALNSEESDFGPAWYRNSLVFTSARKNKSGRNKIIYGNQQGYSYTDIYIGKLSEENDSGEVKLLDISGVNEKYFEGPACFSSNADEFFFSREDIKTGSNIYYTYLQDGRWMDPQRLYFPEIEYATHPSISSDGKTLYFVTMGHSESENHDIYVVNRDGEGWGVPQPVGVNINTAGRESFPYIHANGSLFFASDRAGGMGGLDIFVARPEGNGWAIPENIGPTINSASDDFAIILDEKEQHGYFSSNREGNDDIYAFRKIETVVGYEIAGLLHDEDAQKPLVGAVVKVKDRQGRIVQQVSTDEQGAFSIATPAQDTYILEAEAEGHAPYRSNVEAKIKGTGVGNTEIALKKLLEVPIAAYIYDVETRTPIDNVHITFIDDIQPANTTFFTTGVGGLGSTMLTNYYNGEQIDSRILLQKEGYPEGVFDLHKKLDGANTLYLNDYIDNLGLTKPVLPKDQAVPSKDREKSSMDFQALELSPIDKLDSVSITDRIENQTNEIIDGYITDLWNFVEEKFPWLLLPLSILIGWVLKERKKAMAKMKDALSEKTATEEEKTSTLGLLEKEKGEQKIAYEQLKSKLEWMEKQESMAAQMQQNMAAQMQQNMAAQMQQNMAVQNQQSPSVVALGRESMDTQSGSSSQLQAMVDEAVRNALQAASQQGHNAQNPSLQGSPDHLVSQQQAASQQQQVVSPNNNSSSQKEKGGSKNIRAIAGLARNNRIATAVDDSFITLWKKSDDNKLIKTAALDAGDRVVSMDFSPNGHWLAGVTPQGDLILWDIAEDNADRYVCQVFRHPDNPLHTLAFVTLPEDEVVLAVGGEQATALYQVNSRYLQPLVEDKAGGHVMALSCTEEGFLLATAVDGRSGLLLEKAKKIIGGLAVVWGKVPAAGLQQAVVSLALTTDGHYLATVNKQGEIAVWDVREQNMMASASFGEVAIERLNFSPDGNILSFRDENGCLRLWTFREGNDGAAVEEYADPIQCFAYESDGERLLVVESKGTIDINGEQWTMQDEEPVWRKVLGT